MSKKPTPGDVRAIIPRLKQGMFRQMFSGKPFVHTIIELLKNSRDYGGTNIAISFLGRDQFMIVDNGDGMGAANRDGFMSVNDTTSVSERQAGRYGTGIKQMLYSHALSVEVLTAPAEEPEFVYRFRFNTDDYESMVRDERPLVPERMLKSATSWPHASKTGSQIVYTLRDPKSKAIFRGEKLAAELAARLPIKFADIVTVDGQSIPAKKIVGKVFRHSEEHAQLGKLHVELYRPERRRSDEDLRLAGVEVGEIPMKNLARVLGELQDMIPPVFKMDGVCGTLTIPAFKTYANEDRQTIDAKIADHPAIMQFIRFLQRIAPNVQKELELRMDAADHEEVMSASVQEVKSLLSKAYGEGSEEDDGEDDSAEDDLDDEHHTDGEKPPIRLVLERREFEPGEQIVIRAQFNAATATSYNPTQLHWNLRKSRATVTPSDVPGEMVLTAGTELGEAEVSVEIPGTPYACRRSYRVVAERKFRLSLESARIEVGKQLLITAINVDKLGRTVTWTCGGRAGDLKPSGGKATYCATRPGQELVTAHAGNDPRINAECRIVVTGQPRQQIRIKDHLFRLHHLVGNPQSRPVSIIQMSKVHDLHISSAGSGMQVAKDRGGLTLFLTMAIALEYASFVKLTLKNEEAEPSDVTLIQQEIIQMAYQVFQEILQRNRTA